jgi:hypothetical protein
LPLEGSAATEEGVSEGDDTPGFYHRRYRMKSPESLHHDNHRRFIPMKLPAKKSRFSRGTKPGFSSFFLLHELGNRSYPVPAWGNPARSTS